MTAAKPGDATTRLPHEWHTVGNIPTCRHCRRAEHTLNPRKGDECSVRLRAEIAAADEREEPIRRALDMFDDGHNPETMTVLELATRAAEYGLGLDRLCRAKSAEIVEIRATAEREQDEAVRAAQRAGNNLYAAILRAIEPHFPAGDRGLEWDVLPGTLRGLALRAEAAERALAPFAAMAAVYYPSAPDDFPLLQHGELRVTVGDLRRAAAVKP